jgi:hypothetical protein
MKTFDFGQGVRLLCPLQVSGVPTDPATLSLVVHPPSGVDVTYTLAGGGVLRDSAGSYHVDLVCQISGFWEYAWTSTGPAAAFRGRFYVNPPVA